MKLTQKLTLSLVQMVTLTIVAVAVPAQQSLATPTLVYPQTSATFEVEVTSTDALGQTFFNNLNRLVLPETDHTGPWSFDVSLRAKVNGTVVNPLTGLGFRCWFNNGDVSAYPQTSGNYAVALVSRTSEVTTCRLTVTGAQRSTSASEFRFGLDNANLNFGRVGFTFGTPTLVVSTLPTLAIAPSGGVSVTAAVWSNGRTPAGQLYACSSLLAQITSPVQAFPQGCQVLYAGPNRNSGRPSDLTSAYWNNSTIVNNMMQDNFQPLESLTRTRPHIIYLEQTQGNYIYTPSVLVQSGSSQSISSESDQVSEAGQGQEEMPVAFGGPKIASLVKVAADSASSNQMRLVGKRMHKVTSASVGGLQATISATRSTLSITVPEGLAPGIYNLVLESTDGRLTIMRFVTVR